MSEALLRKTREIVRKLIPFMSEKRIPITPENYQVFYAYFSGEKPGLTERIDKMVRDNAQFTDAAMEMLHQQMYALEYTDEDMEKAKKEMAVAEKVSGETTKLMNDAIADIKSGEENASKYGVALEKGSSDLSLSQSQEKLQEVINALAIETLDTQKVNEAVTKKLEESHKQLKSLSHELQAAREEARTDSLTRLSNRRCFEEDMADAIALTSVGDSCSIILLDIDHFKNFNDSYGHQIGDKALERVSDELRFRDNDRIRSYRYGGEEFALLCYGLDLDAAYHLAERLRAGVEGIGFTVKGKDVPLTISLGVAEIKKGSEVKDALKNADDAMYLAKESGRNCTKTESDITI